MSWWDRQNRAADAYNIKLREIQAREDAAEAAQETAAQAKLPGKLPGMPEGRFSSGGGTLATQTPGVENAAKASALREAREATELGSPESYATPKDKGIAPPPQPAEVIRGMQRTYAAPAPTGEGMLQEYSNPLRAQQAYNRARGVGEYVYPDVTGERAKNLAFAKGLEAETAKTTEATRVANATADFDKMFQPQHFDWDKEKKSYVRPQDEALNNIYQTGLSNLRRGMTAEKSYEAIKPQLINYYYKPENIEKALQLAAKEHNTTVTTQDRADALSGRPDMKEKWFPYILRALKTSQAGFWPVEQESVVP